MNYHDLINPTVGNAAAVGGMVTAAASGLVAFATASTPDAANGGVIVGAGSLIVAVLGLGLRAMQIYYADRKDGRDQSAQFVELRKEVVMLRETNAWLRDMAHKIADKPASDQPTATPIDRPHPEPIP